MKTLKEWNPDEISSFVRRHKHDYLEVGKKYGTTESYARNLFVNYRARPTITLISACAIDGIDPLEFFTAGDTTDDGKFYPDRGDIVLLSGKTARNETGLYFLLYHPPKAEGLDCSIYFL